MLDDDLVLAVWLVSIGFSFYTTDGVFFSARADRGRGVSS